MARRAVLAACVTVALVATSAGGFVSWVYARRPVLEGRVSVADLGAEVSIRRDASGVPHIRASSLADALAALGFVHAQDRRLQMEVLRRTANGTLAELQGEEALGSDRLFRTLGTAEVAAEEVGLLSPADRSLHEAYARGVNAATTQGRTGPAFAWMARGVPESPWRPVDCALVQKTLSWSFHTGYLGEIASAALVREVGAERLHEFLPGAPPAARGAADAFPVPVRVRVELPWEALAAAWRHGRDGLPLGGSNAWAVAAGRSASGAPLLAADPHVPTRLPSIWYAARITTPNHDLFGATVPGIPAVVIGRNRHFAWGVTVVGENGQDLFVEEVDLARPDVIRTWAGPQRLSTRQEHIRVRGREREEVLRVRVGPNGPLLSDLDPGLVGRALGGSTLPASGDGRHAVALAWNGLEAAPPNRFLRMNLARDWSAFREALRDHGTPVLNFVYADASHIGYQMAGHVPVRGGPPSRLPVAAWRRGGEWVGRIPYDQLPRLLDPPDGLIVSANARVTRPEATHHISFLWGSTPERRERIRELLGEQRVVDLDAMADIQLDVREPEAERLGAWAASAASPELRGLVTQIAAWDGRTASDSHGALSATVFREELAREVLGSVVTADTWQLLQYLGRFLQVGLRRAMDDPAGRFFHPDPEQARERRERAVRRALQATRDRLGPQPLSWGRMHAARFRSSLIPMLPWGGGLLGRWLEPDPVPAPGGMRTVNAAPWDPRVPFEVAGGATYRQLVDLSGVGRSRYRPPVPGQSEDPLSTHYADSIDGWIEGVYLPLPDSATRPAGRKLVLTPP